MKTQRLTTIPCACAAMCGLLHAVESASARGPLRMHPDNPRYFTDGSGKAIYLTGSRTWNNLVDMGVGHLEAWSLPARRNSHGGGAAAGIPVLNGCFVAV